MALDSDVMNGDQFLQVTFYEYEGEGMFKGRLHVRIVTPGDKTNIIDRLAREDDQRRFQREYLHWQMRNAETMVVGTPLSVWRAERPDELTDGQLQELLILKFHSVEQMAMASDMQVQRIGMGAQGMRERARLYLSSKNAQQSGADLQNAKSEIETLKAQMSAFLNKPKRAAAARRVVNKKRKQIYKPKAIPVIENTAGR